MVYEFFYSAYGTVGFRLDISSYTSGGTHQTIYIDDTNNDQYPYCIRDIVNLNGYIDFSLLPSDAEQVLMYWGNNATNIPILGLTVDISVDYQTMLIDGVSHRGFLRDGWFISTAGWETHCTKISDDIIDLRFLEVKTLIENKINTLPATVTDMIVGSSFEKMDYFDLNGNYGSFLNGTIVYLYPNNEVYTVEKSYLFRNDTGQFLIMCSLIDQNQKRTVAPQTHLSMTLFSE
jgi:hypothetical protein